MLARQIVRKRIFPQIPNHAIFSAIADRVAIYYNILCERFSDEFYLI
jgi:hypothetical protein